ncbi:hypothetical protein GCK72_014744 [Caenorhabditis remanei]|uniref:fatty acid amide hydrolase n=1 Tax=Caenorhabditis remanei TaxID=31234 RepID=A0A6A5GUK5_CAERE|nr:hypothetical protein GCK72_014744 [Caenorhabditis remanei]KAF1758286.1 hypothetical protein GCK72_014744 [Caenorhabditis remanei]
MLFYVALLILGASAYYCHFQLKRRKIVERLEKVVQRKRDDILKNIEEARRISDKLDSKRRDYIGNLDFEQLKEELQTGSVTCVEAVRTYFHKAILAHEKTNAVTCFILEAEQQAEELDEKAKLPSFVKPPMFGIPLSLKECLKVKGYDTTRGFVQDAYRPSTEDSIQIEHYKKLGLIPFCQTNVPQSLLSYNCSNPLFGTTTNPFDSTRTCGGSSGGEGALIGAKGSLIGIGTDVGGSVRIPCHFTGIAGIKPSKMRFAHRGGGTSVPGKPLVDANEGIMAQNVTSNVELLKSVWGDIDFQSDRDPYCPPVHWNESLYSSEKKLRIGYYIDDGWFTPTPALQRAVLESKKHLENAGHTVIPFHPPRLTDVIQWYFRALFLDGGQFILNKLMNDIIEPTITFQRTLCTVPAWIQRLLSYPVSLVFPRLGMFMKSLTRDTFELREAYAAIEAYREEYVSLMLKDNLDVILCPPSIMPAPQHDVPSKLLCGASYTFIYNLLDFGAGVVPVTTVNKSDEEKLINEYPETDKWYQITKKATIGSIGMPIGVQVAAPPFREEAVLRTMREIEIAVSGKLEI